MEALTQDRDSLAARLAAAEVSARLAGHGADADGGRQVPQLQQQEMGNGWHELQGDDVSARRDDLQRQAVQGKDDALQQALKELQVRLVGEAVSHQGHGRRCSESLGFRVD